MITLLGWFGAILALVAYAQTRAARFRQIALLSSVALLTFNLMLGVWSNAALESALVAVNVRRLVQLTGRGGNEPGDRVQGEADGRRRRSVAARR